MIAEATKKLPTFVAKKASIRCGSSNQMMVAMKYVSPKMAMIETRTCVVIARIRREISIRSRIVRPTVANVEARLPPTSQLTESAEEKSTKVSSRHALRQTVKDGLGIVAKTDPTGHLVELFVKRRMAFTHGTLGRIHHAEPAAVRPPSGQWRRPVALRRVHAPFGKHRLHLPCEKGHDQSPRAAIDRADAKDQPQDRGHDPTGQPRQEPMPP